MLLHPHPVAEQRATGERRRRVDGQHADPQAARSKRGHERGRRGRLAHPGGAGKADHLCVAGSWREQGHDFPELPGRILDQRDQPRDRPRITGDRRIHQIGGGGGTRPGRGRGWRRSRDHAGTRRMRASP